MRGPSLPALCLLAAIYTLLTAAADWRAHPELVEGLPTADLAAANSLQGHPEQQLAAIVPGQVLVRLHRWHDHTVAERVARDHGFRVRSAISPLGIYLVEVPVGREAEAVATLRSEREVAWAQTDGLNQAMLVPNDTLYRTTQWNLRQIGMEAAWDITRGDGRTVVAVLDTGVDLRHPELIGNLVDGYDFLNGDPVPEDDSSHGTHTSGIIAARGNNSQGVAGVAWEVKIMPIKVLNARGLGPESTMIRGVVYAVDNGAKIINISSGTTRGSEAMEEAVVYAHGKGALLISAAGNSGDKDNAVIYPAAYPQVLAVGATDRSNAVSPFSQRHSYVGVVAPGVDIPSTAWEGAGIGRYALATGTSSAAPHVAGLAALLWSLEPALTNDQVRKLIIDNAEDLGPRGPDEAYGYGFINAARALRALRPQPSATPVQAVQPETLTPTPLPPTAPTTPAPALPTLAPLPTPAPLARGTSDWYFAEGTTKRPFDTWLHILNPNPQPVEVRISYLLTDGPVIEQRLTVAPDARVGVPVNQALPNVDFSVRVQADSTIYVERSMFFGHDGHTTAGVSAPSTTWYLAEGSSVPPFDTWILLQNPNPRPVAVRLTFFGDNGSRGELLQLLLPNTRRNVYVNLVFPSQEFATTIVADAPIVAERAMYFDQGRAGHGTVAVSRPARTWYLAEGSTLADFETWLVLQNPGDQAAQVQIRFLRELGPPVQTTHLVPPRGRTRIVANKLLGKQSFGAAVESTMPIVVERVMFFGAELRGAHASTGVLAPSTEWYLAEGSTRSPFEEQVAVLNPNTAVADLEMSLLPAGGGQPRLLHFQAPPEGRLTINMNEVAPDSEFSIRVRASKPVVVERSMYFADGAGGANAPGIAR